MQTRLISITIGTVLVISIGSLVYITKKPAVLPIENDTIQTNINNTIQTPLSEKTNTGGTSRKFKLDDDDDEEEGGIVISPITTPQIGIQPALQTGTSSGGIALSQIAKHNSRTSCWSAINGGVYDLTSWIPNHPGGEQTILSLCGVDGSNGYNGQHGGKSKSATILVGFKIGTLAK